MQDIFNHGQQRRNLPITIGTSAATDNANTVFDRYGNINMLSEIDRRQLFINRQNEFARDQSWAGDNQTEAAHAGYRPAEAHETFISKVPQAHSTSKRYKKCSTGQNVSHREWNYPSDEVDEANLSDTGFNLSSRKPQMKLFFRLSNKRMSKDMVFEQFSKYGTVSYLRIPFSEVKSKNLGYGFVSFESSQLADRLLTKQISMLLDHLPVDFKKYEPARFKARKRKQVEVSDLGTICHFSDGQSVSGGWTHPLSIPTMDSREFGSHNAALSSETAGRVLTYPIIDPHLDHFVKPTKSRYHFGKGTRSAKRNREANLRYNYATGINDFNNHQAWHTIISVC